MQSPSTFPGLAGLVMAGGQSRRMGADKAMLRLGSGPTLLDLACAKISKLCPAWHVSCARGKARPGYPCLEDKLENFGPLAGVLRGLENASEHGCHALLVLACDLPLMTESVLAHLWKLHIQDGQRHLLAVYQNALSGILEMQAAIYNVKALPLFQKAAKGGLRKLAFLIPAKAQLRIPYSSPLEPCFLNCNSPADIDKAMEIIKKKPGFYGNNFFS